MTNDDKATVSDETTLWFKHALLGNGWADNVRLTLAGGLLTEIETDVVRQTGDEAYVIAVPGMPNVHSHAFQRGMAGLAERRGPASDNFWTWREAMYRFLDRGGPEEIEAITALAFAEMLESGFTRVAEFHYLHTDPDGRPYADRAEITSRIVGAAEQTGIGLTLLPVFYAHSGFGGAPPTRGQRRFIHDVDSYAALLEDSRRLASALPDAVVGVAPHSLRAVTPEELAAITPLGRGGPVHLHVAEQTREVSDCLAWSGARPVEWLMANAPVDQTWCLVHATHVTPEEVRQIAESGAVAGLCPITEANLGDGVFPLPAYAAAGGRLGVGTDSNIRIDMAEELRMLEYAQRLTLRARNVLAASEGRSTGSDLFEAALSGGSAAVGAPGGLTVGASADIVSLDDSHPALVTSRLDAVLDSWIFAGGREMVGTVWRRGRKVVIGGEHAQRAQIVERYRRAMGSILA